jgi:prevent-host-death family protein
MHEFLAKNTVTITELKARANQIVDAARNSRQPFLITQNGKPLAMILDVETYLKEAASDELSRLIAEGEADIAAGRVQDLDEVLQEIGSARHVSRPRRRRRQS